MAYWAAGGILYVIAQVLTLLILRRSAILRDKCIPDDAPLCREKSSIVMNQKTLTLANTLEGLHGTSYIVSIKRRSKKKTNPLRTMASK